MGQAALDKLTKVLREERRRGCADAAVIGGLDDFLAHWQTEAAGALPQQLVGSLIDGLGSYGALSPAVRRSRIDAALAAIDEGRTEAPPSNGQARSRRARPRTRKSAGGLAPRPRPRFHLRFEDDPAVDGDVATVHGVGGKAAERLALLGIRTVRDLLQHWPRQYRDYGQVVPIGQLEPHSEVTVVGTVAEAKVTRGRTGKVVLWVLLDDTTGLLRLSFFNQPYLAKGFARGRTIAASGKVEHWNGRAVMNSPEWEAIGEGQIHTGRLLPIYPLTEGVSQRWLRRIVANAVEQWSPRLGDPLTERLRAPEKLIARPEAVWAVHLPRDAADLDAARKRLAFDELLGLQLWARQKRRAREARRTKSLDAGRAAVRAFIAALPWPLTDDQQRAIKQIGDDLAAETPMSRHLQGDVGCGKTVVAAAAIVQCVASRSQATLMAPTEILAKQHFRSLERHLQPVGWRSFHAANPGATSSPGGPVLALLVGSMPDDEKRAVREAIADGRVDAAVGTQALIQESVSTARLGLAIVDEQHRFGVLQRALLDRAAGVDEVAPLAAGPAVHSLIMTATPIPRTLAHVLNADLDMTVIAQMPRRPQLPETRWVTPDQRERAYQYIRRRVVDHDERAYIVYPLVEESEHIDARAAVNEFERLDAEVFPEVPMALLHGRMRSDEKEHAMAAFHRGEAKILVATTVIEVGVDVPEATIILIDGAERFGLAQLHQLRGRVGRGARPGTCLLLSESSSKQTERRLHAITAKVPDPQAPNGERLRTGLELSEMDLEIRGPGDYFGTQQSGMLSLFSFARLADQNILSQAARVAEEIMRDDPDLVEAEHVGLRALVEPFLEGASRK